MRHRVGNGIFISLALLCYLPVCGSASEPVKKAKGTGESDKKLTRTEQSSNATTPYPTNARLKRLDDCVLMKSNTTYATQVMESYLELGYYDITREVDIEFDVLPDRYSHNGPLFSIGTPDFQYYEWKTKAFETQYFVIEFVYSAMSLLLKALDEPHMRPMEICKTYPQPYDIGDAQWHHIKVKRKSHWEDDIWFLTLDDIEINHTVNTGNNVFLQDRPAYLGGRPGFRSYQFRGVIKNLEIQGERVPLRGRATYGLVEVWHCSAPEVAKFVESIQSLPVRLPPRGSMGRPRRPGGSRVGIGKPRGGKEGDGGKQEEEFEGNEEEGDVTDEDATDMNNKEEEEYGDDVTETP